MCVRIAPTEGAVMAENNEKIRVELENIAVNLGIIKQAVDILRTECGVHITMAQLLGNDSTVYFSKGIETAAEAVGRTTKEVDKSIPCITRKVFKYKNCEFSQHPKREPTNIYE